jgi:fucose 4-O-acetylase-like acetyltransferase
MPSVAFTFKLFFTRRTSAYCTEFLKMSVKTRFEEVDFLRGAAIVMIVLGHAIIALEKAGLYGSAIVIPDAVILFFYAIHMPIIFAVSGYVSNDNKKGRGEFLSNCAQWILYPYFLWSVITVLIQHVAPSANNLVPFSALLEIAWSPVLLFWFLYVLFIIKILNYFLIGIGLDRFWLAVISAVVYPLLPPDHLRVVYSFFGSLFFYETGAVLAARPALSEELRRLVAANAGWVLAGALAAIAVLIAGIWREWFGALRPMDGFQSTLHLTGALGIAGLAAAARLLRGTRLREALIVCGQYSMCIRLSWRRRGSSCFVSASPIPGLSPWPALPAASPSRSFGKDGQIGSAGRLILAYVRLPPHRGGRRQAARVCPVAPCKRGRGRRGFGRRPAPGSLSAGVSH